MARGTNPRFEEIPQTPELATVKRKTHPCKAPGCAKHVDMKLLMCPTHWRMVDVSLQDAVWKTYRQKHRGGNYEREHWNACRAAIDDVRRKIAEVAAAATRASEQDSLELDKS